MENVYTSFLLLTINSVFHASELHRFLFGICGAKVSFVLVSCLYSSLFLEDSREPGVAFNLPCPQMLHSNHCILLKHQDYKGSPLPFISRLFPHLPAQSHTSAPGERAFWFTCFPGTSRPVQRGGTRAFLLSQILHEIPAREMIPTMHSPSHYSSAVTKTRKPSPCLWIPRV